MRSRATSASPRAVFSAKARRRFSLLVLTSGAGSGADAAIRSAIRSDVVGLLCTNGGECEGDITALVCLRLRSAVGMPFFSDKLLKLPTALLVVALLLPNRGGSGGGGSGVAVKPICNKPPWSSAR